MRMTEYELFKTRLAKLCETGTIQKDVKKRFCYLKPVGSGELIFELCTMLLELFESSGKGDAQYAAVADAVTELIHSLAEVAETFPREVDAITEYIKTSVRCNALGAPEDFARLKADARIYNESLQNIKFGLPIFGLRSDDGR